MKMDFETLKKECRKLVDYIKIREEIEDNNCGLTARKYAVWNNKVHGLNERLDVEKLDNWLYSQGLPSNR